MEGQSFEEFCVENLMEFDTSSATQPTTSPLCEASQILCGSMCDLITPTEDGQEKQHEQLEFFLKAAKCREDQYVSGNFPLTLTCTPYKYDLKVVGKLAADKKDFSIELVDAESLSRPEPVNPETRQGVTLETVETFSDTERVVRFALNWCSFHFRKRSFRLKLICKEQSIFVSSPFHTYARRRDTPYEKSPVSKKAKLGKPLVSALAKQVVQQTYVTAHPMMQQAVCWQPMYSMQVPQTPYYFTPTCYSTPNCYSSLPVPQTPVMSPQTPIPVPPAQPPMKQQRHSPVDAGALKSLERTSLAIQLMSSLSPVERQAVTSYLQAL